MTGTIITAVTATSAVCSGVAGGVYFAFSAMIMPALRSLPAGQAVPAMQHINRSAVRLPFMVVFFGSAVASLAALIMELTAGAGAPVSTSRIVGAGLALVGFGVTVVRNVPLNNALALIASDAIDIDERWKKFSRAWSLANLGRATAAVAATVILADSLARST
ncbi:anthrone oxygenase family protein [Arthrobacter psychrolactophilus]